MSIIEELYYNNLEDAIKCGEDSQSTRADQLESRCSKNLEATLNDSEKELFVKYCDAHADTEEITRNHAFTYALKFGILLMAKAFTGRKDITGERSDPEKSILRRLFNEDANPAEDIMSEDPRYRKVYREIGEKKKPIGREPPSRGAKAT